jgi:hypothetical protein
MKKFVLICAAIFLVIGFSAGCSKKKQAAEPNRTIHPVQAIETNSIAEVNNPKLNRAIEKTTTSTGERRPRDINN